MIRWLVFLCVLRCWMVYIYIYIISLEKKSCVNLATKKTEFNKNAHVLFFFSVFNLLAAIHCNNEEKKTQEINKNIYSFNVEIERVVLYSIVKEEQQQQQQPHGSR